MSRRFTLGAVAYAPKVITIWEGFKDYFSQHRFDFDYILYSNYEAQVEAMFEGAIDAAWNSPLAWIRAERMGRARGTPVSFGPMRDTDQDLTSVLVVRKEAGISSLQDLRAKNIGFGAVDSPQARLIPLIHLRQSGLVADKDYRARVFDVLGGKHGDHIGGERDAAIALMKREVDATWMIDGNYQAFSQEGTLPSGETVVLARTENYDHCIFTLAPGIAKESVNQFSEILLSMKWSDSKVRPLLELEGLKEWRPGRTKGFTLLNQAVESEHFYDSKGQIIEPNYRY
ncbi:MAG TPA: PhnD/SsuA/transferrin family substrate-binding protein [Pseudobdellovibrionaceae bacterium]|jgi:ABC-type phosphate/phosphonate transport system substrate-binding protein